MSLINYEGLDLSSKEKLNSFKLCAGCAEDISEELSHDEDYFTCGICDFKYCRKCLCDFYMTRSDESNDICYFCLLQETNILKLSERASRIKDTKRKIEDKINKLSDLKITLEAVKEKIGTEKKQKII